MRTRLAGKRLALLFLFASAVSAAAQPLSFEETVRQLTSTSPAARARAARLLGESGYPEAAKPIATVITDPDDDVQIAAIVGELNVFLAQKIASRGRVVSVLHAGRKIAAEPAFTSGPWAVGALPVPGEVLTALRSALHDDSARVATEALYAYGILAAQASGQARREWLRASAPDLVALAAAPDKAVRIAAVRVAGRLFEPRRGDDAIDPALGDAVVTALNDRESDVRLAAVGTLGALRYARAVQALTDLFTFHGPGATAEWVLSALARIAHPSSAPLFVSELGSKSIGARTIAIEGLSRSGDPAALDPIRQAAAADRRNPVQLAAAFAETMLGGAGPERLADALTNPKLRDQARGYLVEALPGRTSALTKYANDPEPRIRADIADVLGLAGDPAALAIVEPLQKDADPRVALAADRAVAWLRAPAPRAVP